MKKTLSRDRKGNDGPALIYASDTGSSFPWTLRDGYRNIHLRRKEAIVAAFYILRKEAGDKNPNAFLDVEIENRYFGFDVTKAVPIKSIYADVIDDRKTKREARIKKKKGGRQHEVRKRR
jgi:hypothetical protein